jgi:hypothetical protein
MLETIKKSLKIPKEQSESIYLRYQRGNQNPYIEVEEVEVEVEVEVEEEEEEEEEQDKQRSTKHTY